MGGTQGGCASAPWVENGTGFLVPTRSVATRKAPQGKGAPPVRPSERLGAVAQRADLVATVGNEVQGHNPLLCRDLLGLGRLVATLPRTSRLATRSGQTWTDSDRATQLPRPLPSPPRAQGGDALPPSHAERGNEDYPRKRRTPQGCPSRFFAAANGRTILQRRMTHADTDVRIMPGACRIGSGLVEGTIKQMINLRQKQPGARWKLEQVGPFVELRTSAAGPKWNALWIPK
jgi:hypothetical protein